MFAFFCLSLSHPLLGVLQTLTTLVPVTRLLPDDLIAALTNLMVNLPAVLLSNHQIWKQVSA